MSNTRRVANKFDLRVEPAGEHFHVVLTEYFPSDVDVDAMVARARLTPSAKVSTIIGIDDLNGIVLDATFDHRSLGEFLLGLATVHLFVQGGRADERQVKRFADEITTLLAKIAST